MMSTTTWMPSTLFATSQTRIVSIIKTWVVFAVTLIPLLIFTGNRAKMGKFVNPLWIKILAWSSASIIVALNVKYLFGKFAPQSWQDALGL